MSIGAFTRLFSLLIMFPRTILVFMDLSFPVWSKGSSIRESGGLGVVIRSMLLMVGEFAFDVKFRQI